MKVNNNHKINNNQIIIRRKIKTYRILKLVKLKLDYVSVCEPVTILRKYKTLV